MSKFRKTIRSEQYWVLKGQSDIYNMLNENLKERGDNRRLAEKIGVTDGYISQIMNGESEINPTWKKIVKLCLSLDKVPVLAIKDFDEFIEEQSLNASQKFATSYLNNQDIPSIGLGNVFADFDSLRNFRKPEFSRSTNSDTMTYIAEENMYVI